MWRKSSKRFSAPDFNMITMDAILLGGGIGKRFGDSRGIPSAEALPKQFQLLGTAPVFIHALRSMVALGCFRQIVLAFPKPFLELAQEQIDTYLPSRGKALIRVVAGGERRQDSSCLALESLEEVTPLPARVLIHDACRPYLPAQFLQRVKECMLDRSYGAWVPVVPVVETLKRIENSQVIETVDRSRVHRVQTPQIFEYAVIRGLVEKLRAEPALNFTDDASLCEYYGIPVGTFEGDVRNIKLTYDFELETLRRILGENSKEAPCEPVSATTFTA